MALGLGVLGDGMFDDDARLVEHRRPLAMPSTSLRPAQAHGPVARSRAAAARHRPAGTGDQLGQHHRDRLQRLDLDIVVAARLGMLDREHADRALAPHDRHAGEAVESSLRRFRAGRRSRDGSAASSRLSIATSRRSCRPGPRPAQLGDMDRFLLQPAGGEQLEHAVAQQIDRADLALHRLADESTTRLSLACADPRWPSRRAARSGFHERMRRRSGACPQR